MQHDATSTRETTTYAQTRIYVVRMTQSVLKITKLTYITGARGSRDLWFPFPILAPDESCEARNTINQVSQGLQESMYIP